MEETIVYSTIRLDKPIYVKLTEYGRELYAQYLSATHNVAVTAAKVKSMEHKDITSMELKEFMLVFGGCVNDVNKPIMEGKHIAFKQTISIE